MLTSEEAARRLGVKVSTLYAYVSRGLLRPTLTLPVGAASSTWTRSRRWPPRAGADGRRPLGMATITTGVTQLNQDSARSTEAAWRPSWRGRGVRGRGRVAVAVRGWRRLAGPRSRALPVDRDLRPHALGPRGLRRDDPLRSDRRPPAVAGAAAAATLRWPTWSARLRAGGDGDASIAARLAARLTGTSRPCPEAAVNAALVLLADHELATSTMAVRLAASVRADPYDAFLAGLVTLAGPSTAAPASRPTSCWSWRNVTARPEPSTTSCATGHRARLRPHRLQEWRPALRVAAGVGRATPERGTASPPARRHGDRGGPRRADGQL